MVEVDDLRQVAYLYSGPLSKLSPVRLLLAHDDFDEGGLACAVIPQQGDALAPLHFQVHVPKQGPLPEGLGQVLDGQHLVPPELPFSKADRHLPVLFGLVRLADALDALLHGLSPFENLVVARVGPYAQLLRRLLQLLNLGLLLFVLSQFLLVPPLLLHGVEAVISAVKLRFALLNFHHPPDHLVQKVPVVGDGQNGALEPFQILLQPLGGPQVQMVGGLVQKEDVGVLQNEPGQVDPGLLPAGQHIKGPLPHVLGNGQAVAHLILVGVRLVAAPGLKGGGQLVIAGQ